MEKRIIQFEHDMWDAVLHRDAVAFKKLVLPHAVMICGGYRCLGSEYTSFIYSLKISGASISDMEVIHSNEYEITLHYMIRIYMEDSSAQNLEGSYHVVSMWKRTGEDWNLFFNMTSRVAEPSRDNEPKPTVCQDTI